jgi:hypothetical protein
MFIFIVITKSDSYENQASILPHNFHQLYSFCSGHKGNYPEIGREIPGHIKHRKLFDDH